MVFHNGNRPEHRVIIGVESQKSGKNAFIVDYINYK